VGRRQQGHGAGEQRRGESHSASDQPLPQLLPGVSQATGNRPSFPAELACRFGLGLALQTAQHQRRPVLFRQTLDLLVEDRLQLPESHLARAVRRAMASLFFSCARRSADCRLAVMATLNATPVQPVRQRFRLADRTGVPRQHDEDGLEGVLGVLFVTEHVAADLPDQPGMPFSRAAKAALSLPARKRWSSSPSVRSAVTWASVISRM